MSILCFGDSLTFGSVGHSYIKYLDTNERVLNKGMNGDTTMCMHQRLQKYVAKNNHITNTYIIAIGTNDVLLPYLTTVSTLWRIQIEPRVKVKRCIMNSKLFQEEYEKIIHTVISSGNQMICVGIPMIQLKDFPNATSAERNKMIEKLSTMAKGWVG